MIDKNVHYAVKHVVISIILIGCSSFVTRDYFFCFADALLLLLYIYRANMTMIHMYMVSIICIKNINMHCSVYYMCLHRIYIYVFIFPIMHKFQKVKRKNVNLFITSKIHQSGLWESRNYRNLLLLRITGQNP